MDSWQAQVSEGDAGARLDKWLSEHDAGETRQQLQRWIKAGHVACNGQPVTSPSHKVKTGECYVVTPPEIRPARLEAEAIALDIVFEDDDLLVVNKAAGMVVHPAPGAYSSTLVHALLHHCGDSLSGIGGEARPGIVHRLDKDTSGLMVVAKHDRAHVALSEQLQVRSVSRVYHAIVRGVMKPPVGTIDAPIARSPRNRQKMAVVDGGKPAITHYQTLAGYLTPQHSTLPPRPFASLVECRLETGRTHQIRVHLAEKGCALMGDPVYGGSTSRRLAALYGMLPPSLYELLEGFERQALHAGELAFIHPGSGEAMHFRVSYPADMQALAEALQGLENAEHDTR